MAYDEEVYEKLLKNFELLCAIIQQNTSENQMKADLTKIEEIINKKIPDTLKKNAPEDFYELYTDFKSEYEKFRDFILYDRLIGKNIVALGGGFSSGKSSFLNALMGKSVLPADIDPSTSVPTYIVKGENHEVMGINVFDTKVQMQPRDIKKIAHGFGEVEDDDDEKVTESVTLGHVLENIFFSTPLHKYDNIAFLDTPGYSKPDSEKYSAKTDEQISRGQLNSSNYILSEISEASEMKGIEEYEISKESNEKFDKLMGDDNLRETLPEQQDNRPELNPVERENKFNKLFDIGDFFKKETVQSDIGSTSVEGMNDTKTDTNEHSSEPEGEMSQEPDYSDKREPNSSYEFNGNTYETDDNGQTYKKNGEILPNTEYTVNGNTYKTDENGNKVSCDSNPEYTEEGSRNMKEQKESGGEERLEDDDGGHIIARILGGAEGEENLVPMRRTINRGDYKRMENEIAKALQEGKEVSIHIDIEYDGDSSRPSKIRAEYTIDGKKTVCEFDNVEGSTDLLDSLGDKISDEDYDRLKQTFDEMKEDGCDAAITSVKVEYDENGNPTKVTVGILDESTGIKKYKEYSPR